MKSIKEILNENVSSYTGSEATKAMVMEEIRKRYGEAECKNYDAYHNMRTYTGWLKLGFKPRAGSKAIKSITYLETKDANGVSLKRFKRSVNLFYIREVEFINPERSI